MKLASVIKAEDLQNLQVDENGDYIIPEDIKIYVQEDENQLILDKIQLLESELSLMIEPSVEELIEEGKSNHPYYNLLNELEELKRTLL